MRNAAGREIPDHIDGYGCPKPYHPVPSVDSGSFSAPNRGRDSGADVKLLRDIREALTVLGVRDGATLSFHHHLRNGDAVLNLVLETAARLGLRDLHIAASSIFPVHAPLVEHMRSGVVSSITTAYISGPVADAISAGVLKSPAVLQTHGGRARAISSGSLQIDVAFIAAPAADEAGNISGIHGPAACGPLGYARVDALFAKSVVAITDTVLPYPLFPAEITQDWVDYVVTVPSVGDASKIVSGSTRVTEDPIGLLIAENAANVIGASGLLADEFSFQTGAGGVSLAVAQFVRQRMIDRKVRGSFASGGITSQMVDMLNLGLFRALFDVQCFDQAAIESYKSDPRHQGMSASLYANPNTRGCVADRLDVMILGASEVDLDFNVNVTTRSNGQILGGSGGHSDTAAGSKLAIVTTRLKAGALPKIVERVTTLTTPGASIDAIVTEVGVTVNPARAELADRVRAAGLPVLPIAELFDLANRGVELPPVSQDATRRVVAVQEYRDGSIIDVIRQAG
ncbi:MAG: citrate lyase subunit alpha [Burkholderia sp.]|jgi:citrate lyase subunit alpha/citrate CoA-transferase|uniref:citrate lyase subunit alpha n=1 Tax=Burkholderia sp. TaxID=36773 RepID=UPI00281B0FA6|nr:citrate lyase subunit alpha [Burkholderia sp.]MDR0242932.1 citrate lyase subunit alpha [Burkholderia sp.]